MAKHLFLFTPGIWLGEGVVTFSASPEHIRFYTKWQVNDIDSMLAIPCEQKVELQDTNEKVINELSLYNITSTNFLIKLENALFGQVTGKGLIDDKTIAWEFRSPEAIEGYEVYEIQDNGDYLFHSEYASDQFRTIIDGRIWKKD